MSMLGGAFALASSRIALGHVQMPIMSDGTSILTPNFETAAASLSAPAGRASRWKIRVPIPGQSVANHRDPELSQVPGPLSGGNRMILPLLSDSDPSPRARRGPPGGGIMM